MLSPPNYSRGNGGRALGSGEGIAARSLDFNGIPTEASPPMETPSGGVSTRSASGRKGKKKHSPDALVSSRGVGDDDDDDESSSQHDHFLSNRNALADR